VPIGGRVGNAERTHDGVPAVDVPNPTLTPGAVLTTSAARACVPGYSSSVRDVPESEKEAVYAEYGVPHVPYQHGDTRRASPQAASGGAHQ
jgi:hypothetical protein